MKFTAFQLYLFVAPLALASFHPHPRTRIEDSETRRDLQKTCDSIENDAVAEEFWTSYYNTTYYYNPTCTDDSSVLTCVSDLTDTTSGGTFNKLRDLCKDAGGTLYVLDWSISCSDGSSFNEKSHPFDCADCGDGSQLEDLIKSVSALEWLGMGNETDIDCSFEKFDVQSFDSAF